MRLALVLSTVVACVLPAASQAAPRPVWVPRDVPQLISERFPATLPHTGMPIARLAGELLVDDPTIGRPGSLVIQQRLLWVGDMAGDPFLHVINLASRKIVRSMGRPGEGPGDFKYLTDLMLRPGDDEAVWAFDLALRRLTRVPQDRSRPVRDTRQSRHSSRALRMHWLGAERILVIGPTDTARIILTDNAGRPRVSLAGPLLGHTEVPIETRLRVSDGVHVCVRPDGERFALAYSNAPRVEIFDGAGRFLRLGSGPAWGMQQGDLVRTPSGRWGLWLLRYYYRGCAATARYYYGLFAGRTREAGPADTEYWDSQFVHVFSWTGELKVVLELDALAEAIAIDGDSVLYAGGGSMEGIRRYNLRTALQTN
jgi:hypothetical protein